MSVVFQPVYCKWTPKEASMSFLGNGSVLSTLFVSYDWYQNTITLFYFHIVIVAVGEFAFCINSTMDILKIFYWSESK